MVEWKGHASFIDIAAQTVKHHPRTHFFVTGEVIDQGYYKFLNDKIKENNLDAFFTFTGFVEDTESFISGLDIVVHTARNEPFGRIVAEAMCLGTAVVAYDCGGPAEIITNGETGLLVPHGDVDEAVKQILYLINNPASKVEIERNAREYSSRHFDMKEYITKFEHLLHT